MIIIQRNVTLPIDFIFHCYIFISSNCLVKKKYIDSLILSTLLLFCGTTAANKLNNLKILHKSCSIYITTVISFNISYKASREIHKCSILLRRSTRIPLYSYKSTFRYMHISVVNIADGLVCHAAPYAGRVVPDWHSIFMS